jgi:heat-inducible transcriptional repressor
VVEKKVSPKQEREEQVLLGVVELYLKTGRPISSLTLKEHGFDHLSSATIRNYFSGLEERGFLVQQHSSGGREPTAKAYQFFAEMHYTYKAIDSKDDLFLSTMLLRETKELASYLQKASEAIAELSGCAVFLSTPRFDQDFIANMKLLNIDEHRILVVFISEFSLIHTEVLFSPRQFSSFSLKRIEEYFRFRLTGNNEPEMADDEEVFAQKAFNELILRHFVNYANFTKEDIYKAGFSKLLNHSELQDIPTLANSLSLFENSDVLRKILKEGEEKGDIHCLIGDDLNPYLSNSTHYSVITMPYTIQGKSVGSVGVLSPLSIDYRNLFALLRTFSLYLSENLNNSISTHQLSYRKPHPHALDAKEAPMLLAHREVMKTKK